MLLLAACRLKNKGLQNLVKNAATYMQAHHTHDGTSLCLSDRICMYDLFTLFSPICPIYFIYLLSQSIITRWRRWYYRWAFDAAYNTAKARYNSLLLNSNCSGNIPHKSDNYMPTSAMSIYHPAYLVPAYIAQCTLISKEFLWQLGCCIRLPN